MSGATKILMGSGGVDLPSDDEFDNVSFLSHFDGSNNGTNIVYDDGSDSNHTITVGGTPSQGSFGPFARVDGEWSNHFSGNSDYFDVAASSDFAFGTGDFTVELFIKTSDPSADSYDRRMYLNDGPDGNAIGNIMLLLVAASPNSGKVGVQTNGLIITSSTVVTDGAWHHVAMVRSSGTLSLYIDGTSEGTPVSNTDNITANSGSPRPRIGSYGAAGGDFNGYVSNLRVLSSALYTSNFTPPTSALTAITNTKLLTCQSNQFKDNSASGHTLTRTTSGAGFTPSISAFTPFLTSEVYDSAVNGASAYFDGSGDYLSAADSADWTLGDTFTIEAWVNPHQNETYNTVVEQNGASGFYYSVIGNPPTSMQFYKGIGGGVQVDSATLPQMSEQWNHVAFVVSGGTGYHYINGVRSGSSGSISIGDIGTALQIGQQGSSYPYKGLMSDVRIVNGTAVYSGTTYTVPTAPLTAITNTKLLLNMADAQVFDSAAQNTMVLLGNADSSTTQQKFGTASLALDGTGDAAQVRLGDASRYNVSSLTGPFTIECWARADDTTNAYMWCNGQYTIEFGLNGDNLFLYTAAGADGNFFTGGEFTVNTWHHVAIVRDSSNVIKCYLNGTASGTTFTNSTAFLATEGIFYIGGEWATSASVNHGWDGYIDDFRISRFARYTSNFTAPTEAFPDKGQES